MTKILRNQKERISPILHGLYKEFAVEDVPIRYWAMDAFTLSELRLQDLEGKILNYQDTSNEWKAFGITILIPAYKAQVDEYFIEAIT